MSDPLLTLIILAGLVQCACHLYVIRCNRRIARAAAQLRELARPMTTDRQVQDWHDRLDAVELPLAARLVDRWHRSLFGPR